MDTLLERLQNIGEPNADIAKLKKLIEAFWQKEFKKLNESEWDEAKSNLYQHAKRELELAGVEKDIYGQMLPNAILEIVRTFAKQGHSGMSAAYSLHLLDKLLRYEHLTPITDNPEDWMNVSEYLPGTWQCRRNPALFSADGGKTYYHVDKHTEIMTAESHKKA
jgi:hypothetical protein